MIYYRSVSFGGVIDRIQSIARRSPGKKNGIAWGYTQGDRSKLKKTIVAVVLRDGNIRDLCNCLESVCNSTDCKIIVLYEDGLNELIDSGEYDYVAVVDSRVEVYRGWLEHLLTSMDKYSTVSAILSSQFVLPFGIDFNYVQTKLYKISTIQKIGSVDRYCCVIDCKNRNRGVGIDLGVVVRFFGGQILEMFDMQNVCEAILDLSGEKHKRRDVVFVFREMVVCGAVLLAVHICNGLRRRGYNAYCACTRLDPGHYEKIPFETEPLVCTSYRELINKLGNKLKNDSVVIAPLKITVSDVVEICNKSCSKPVYYIQDDERLFQYPNGEYYNDASDVEESYKQIDRLVSNSLWVCDELKKLGHRSRLIFPGVDCAVYRPQQKSNLKVRIMAHSRPSTPRRGWAFICQVLNRVSMERDVEIITYDEDPENIWVSQHRHLGRVSPNELAIEMGSADIFLEGSEVQGFGMQALEAMACGCALVCTKNRGIDTFGLHGYDCFIVNHNDIDACVASILLLIDSVALRNTVGQNARETAKTLSWRFAVDAWQRYIDEI